MKPIPNHGPCFVCGNENPHSMGMTFYEESGIITANLTFSEHQQGPPKYTHGGALSAVLDEMMGAAAWCTGHAVLAAHLQIDFIRSVPLGTPLTAKAWISNTYERKIYAESEIKDADGKVLVRGRGLFIKAPDFYDVNFLKQENKKEI